MLDNSTGTIWNNEVADLVLDQVFEEAGAQLFLGLLRPPAAEDGRQRLVVLQERRQLDERIEVPLLRLPDTLGWGHVWHLADPVGVLLSEAHARPGLDKGWIRRRNECVVAVAAFVHPAGGRGGVQVAQILGGFDGVSGGLDPDVRAPDLVAAPHAEKEADYARAAKGDGARGTLDRRQHFHFRSRSLGVLVPDREQRLGRPVSAMARGEKLASMG